MTTTIEARTGRRESPYVGLSFYEEADAELFFGRDHERKVIIGNLRASRLTLLYAQSGVGKSSLLRAGVASRLRELAHRGLSERGSPRYVPVVFSSWKDDPVSELIEEIERGIAPFIRGGFSPDLPTESLEDAVSAATSAIDATLLIVLDQFEEYFLYRSRESRQVHFADQLATCVNRGDLRANFLIAIREDAYAGLGDLFKGRVANVYGNYLHLENLGQDTAREAIERPIARYNEINPGAPVEIEPALVDAVLKGLEPANFASEQAGKGTIEGVNGGRPERDEIAAPYLQLVMKRLWETEMAAGSHVLHLSTLQALGGTKMIVRTHLDRALGDLSPENREIAVDVFHQLVTPSGTKIAHTVADLAEYSSQSEAQVESLLERLAGGEARILRPVPSPSGEDARRFEISHDLLAPAILDWRSRQAAVRLEREKQVAEHRAHRERNRARRFRALAVGALVLLGLAAFLALLARSDNQISQSRRLAAIAEVAIRSDPEAGTLLALQALRKHYTQEAEAALRHALPQLQLTATLRSRPPVRSAVFSPDDTTIATAAADGMARTWDAGSGQPLKTLSSSGGLNSVVFSPDGAQVLTAGDDGAARMLDASSGQQVRVLSEPGGAALTGAAYSHNGKLIVTASTSGFARVWDARTGKQIRALGDPNGQGLLGVAFSPDGSRIVSADFAGHLVIWDAGTGARRSISTPYSLYSAAFSPDSSQVATAGGDGKVRIWDARTGVAVRQLTGPDSFALFSAAFSPSGNLIASAGREGTVRIWNARTGQFLRLIRAGGHVSLLSVAFSHDSKAIAAAGADGEVHVWDVNGHEHAGSPLRERRETGSNRLRSVAFSAHGTLVATASQFGTATVWNATTHQPIVVIGQSEGDAVNSIAFIGDSYIATADQSGRLYVWNALNGQLENEVDAAYGHPLNSVKVDPANPRLLLSAGDDGKIRISDWTKVNRPELAVFPSKGSIWPIRSAAFSRDGRLILSGSADGYTRVWNLKGGQIGSRLGFGSAVNSVGFNQRGTKIMDAGDDGSAYFWNAKSRVYTGLLTEPGSPIVRSAVFSPDDQSVLTGSTDGIARLWDANTQNQLLAFAGHGGPVNDAAFSTNGTSVATASADGTVRLWRALPREQQGFPLSGPAATVTAAFDPKDSHSVATASSNGTLELWNTITRSHRSISQPSGGGGASAEFSRDGRWLVSTGGDAGARIWNTTTYNNPVLLDTNRAHCSNPQSVTANNLNTANFSPDGRMVVTGSADGTGCIWNWNGTTQRASLQGKFSEPAGSTLGVVNVGASGLRWAVFSPDNRRVLTASDDGTARVWNVATRSQVAVFAEPGGEGLTDAWFSPDGKLIVTASNDGTTRIWNLATGRQLQVLREPGRTQVFNAAFSPDGTKVVTCAGTARIWSVATGRQLTEFQYGNTLSDCEFSPDRQGKLVMTAGTDGKTRIFTTELAGSLSSIERIASQRVTRHQLTADEQRTYLAGS